MVLLLAQVIQFRRDNGIVNSRLFYSLLLFNAFTVVIKGSVNGIELGVVQALVIAGSLVSIFCQVGRHCDIGQAFV